MQEGTGTPKERRRNRQESSMHEFLVRLDQDLYRALRKRAYREQKPLAAVVREALGRHLS